MIFQITPCLWIKWKRLNIAILYTPMIKLISFPRRFLTAKIAAIYLTMAAEILLSALCACKCNCSLSRQNFAKRGRGVIQGPILYCSYFVLKAVSRVLKRSIIGHMIKLRQNLHFLENKHKLKILAFCKDYSSIIFKC